jgi:hypothetical protein
MMVAVGNESNTTSSPYALDWKNLDAESALALSAEKCINLLTPASLAA